MKRPPFFWPLVAAAAGLFSSGLLYGAPGLPRAPFIAGDPAVVGGLVAAWLRTEGIDFGVQWRRRWRGGMMIGAIAGVALAGSVIGQPASARPEGLPEPSISKS